MLLSGKTGITRQKPPESAGKPGYLPGNQPLLLSLVGCPARAGTFRDSVARVCLFQDRVCSSLSRPGPTCTHVSSQVTWGSPMPREVAAMWGTEKFPVYLLGGDAQHEKSTLTASSSAIVIIPLLTNAKTED